MKIPSVLVVVFLAALASSPTARAQVGAGSWGVGAHFGEPTGLTLKTYTARPVTRGGASFNAYDLLFGWDFDDFFFANAHALHEGRLGDSPVNYFLGPGLFLGFTDRGDDDVLFGISGQFGINYFVDRFEIFVQLTPRLQLVEETDGDMGGGIGARYYF
ncbi:MAG TPA: hypothetical protein VF190_10270 [Rhodothermales bacterium]